MGKLIESQKMIDNAFDMIKKLEDDNLFCGNHEETEDYIAIRYSLAANKFLFLYLTNYKGRVSIMQDHNNIPDTIFIRKEINETWSSNSSKKK